MNKLTKDGVIEALKEVKRSLITCIEDINRVTVIEGTK